MKITFVFINSSQYLFEFKLLYINLEISKNRFIYAKDNIWYILRKIGKWMWKEIFISFIFK